jgi:hypothetical protein
VERRIEAKIEGPFEILLKLRHRRAFKAYNVIDAQDAPVKACLMRVSGAAWWV